MFEHLSEVIDQRYSERKYEHDFRLSDEQKVMIEAKMKELLSSAYEINIDLIENTDDNLFKGFILSYGKVNAPYMLVFSGKKQDIETAFKVGQLAELLVLELTLLGLQTCFVSGTYKGSEVLSRIQMADDYEIYVTVALGKAKAVWVNPQHKRKDVEDIAKFMPRKSAAWIYTALEAARLAPSALNRQPARFMVDMDQHVTAYPAKESVAQYLDLGIAAANFQVAAEEHGHVGDWVRREGQYYFLLEKSE
ncbi:nitroreductase family protein [Culicoidibacter larvae]|uniref:Putative nitroreductase TM1586 domain-containing protein n=1 Tax=Culicoidibacter larvae TaxID=2579976 RepID=A0A5R8QGQ7_9FIRM|nr:nitroreductase family protein [Culicoidibacter larvae]TLG77152.1 hypothetical protein FEZ08_00610 [Culicoidibacter larvae]